MKFGIALYVIIFVAHTDIIHYVERLGSRISFLNLPSGIEISTKPGLGYLIYNQEYKICQHIVNLIRHKIIIKKLSDPLTRNFCHFNFDLDLNLEIAAKLDTSCHLLGFNIY